MSDEIAIKIDHVSKDFRLPHEKVDSVKSLFVNPFRSREGLKTETQHALKNINFEVKKGEFFGIVGRNGSGKSTLLKIIANIYQPTKGKVTVNGRLVPFIELGVGFNPELSGRENTYLNGALMGFSTEEVDAKYDEIVKFAELERFMDQQLKNYSSGMQVRLAFSVATILADSDILLIDEVLAVGDASFQKKCYDYFSKLKKEKKTVVFVTHDMNAVREYCDRAILIDDSQVVKTGTAEVVSKEYTKLFIEQASVQLKQEEKPERWGDKRAVFTGVSVAKEKVLPSDSIILNMSIRANDDVEGAIVGFSVKDPSGAVVTGTNTYLEGQRLLSLKSGMSAKLEWVIDNIFSDGEYTFDIAIASGSVIHEWWDDAIAIRFVRENHVPHSIVPPVRLKIDK